MQTVERIGPPLEVPIIVVYAGSRERGARLPAVASGVGGNGGYGGTGFQHGATKSTEITELQRARPLHVDAGRALRAPAFDHQPEISDFSVYSVGSVAPF